MDVIGIAQYATAWVTRRIRSRIDFKSEAGATAVEYGIMVALIAAIIVAVVATLGGQIKTAFCTVAQQLGGGTATGC